MNTRLFFEKIRSYAPLSDAAEAEWTALLKTAVYPKGDHFIRVGQIPRKVSYVVKGLFSQNYITEEGETVIKYFFPEVRIAGSVPAILTRTESLFSITALEDSEVLEYDFHSFKTLVAKHRDIADFYIRYMEQHWII